MRRSAVRSFLVFGLIVLSGPTAVAVTFDLFRDDGATERVGTLECVDCAPLIYTRDGTPLGGPAGSSNTSTGQDGGRFGWSPDGFGELFEVPTPLLGVAPDLLSEAQVQVDWAEKVLDQIIGVDLSQTPAGRDGALFTSDSRYVILRLQSQDESLYALIQNNQAGSGPSPFSFFWDGNVPGDDTASGPAGSSATAGDTTGDSGSSDSGSSSSESGSDGQTAQSTQATQSTDGGTNTGEAGAQSGEGSGETGSTSGSGSDSGTGTQIALFTDVNDGASSGSSSGDTDKSPFYDLSAQADANQGPDAPSPVPLPLPGLLLLAGLAALRGLGRRT